MNKGANSGSHRDGPGSAGPLQSFPQAPPGAAMPQSVLDRVKAFLPLMEQANKELEQTISVEGAETVQIDAHLHEDKAEAEAEDEEGEGEDDNDEKGEKQGEEKRTVQLQFALGDFDGTALAQAEDLQKQEEAEAEAEAESETGVDS